MKQQGTTYRGRTYKEVTVEHNFDDRPVSDDLIVGWAMAKAGETPESLFGWSVNRPSQYPHMAVVTLHTD
jgi:hypothetical protein